VIDAAEAKLIRVIFPGSGGQTGEVALHWVGGKSIKSYFKDTPLRPYNLIGMRRHCRLQNQRGERLRLTSTPAPGDTVIMTRYR
jgi:hypothetical protein